MKHPEEIYDSVEHIHDDPISSSTAMKITVGALLFVAMVPLVAFSMANLVLSKSPKQLEAKQAVYKELLQPVAKFELDTTPKEPRTGEQVYANTCSGCHATGASGSPKMGDNGAWAPRIAKGYDVLLDHALKGFNAMPARGGNPKLQDIEVARAVVFMANKSGGSFPEPKAPEAKIDAAK